MQQTQNIEVLKLVREMRIEIAKMQLDQVMKKASNPNALYQKRKEMARLLAGNGVVIAPVPQAKSSKGSKDKKEKEEKNN